MNIPFTEISSIKYNTIAQYAFYSNYWTTFNRVEVYNSNVSTTMSLEQKIIPYYQFVTNDERNAYTNGLSLQMQYLGGNVPQVSKDIPIPPLAAGPPYSLPQIIGVPSTPVTYEQRTLSNADLAVYINISTFNASKPLIPRRFTSESERLQYRMAEAQILRQ